MPRGLIDPSLLSDIADAIREKNGSSDTYTPAEMAEAIADITTGDSIDHETIPDYVKAEALEVAARVRPHLKSDSIVFIAGSDSHESTTEHVADGNLHGGMSMKALAYLLPLDFACYLGDYTAGSNTTTLAEGRGHFAAINADIDEAFRGLPQFRTTGNHDPLGYSYAANNNQSLGLAELYQLIGKYNEDSGATMGSTTSGYCYRDFADKSVRVICLNTAEADADGNQPPHGSAEFMTTAQKCWFADTLISTPQDYGIIVLCHYPLDWGKIVIQASHILRAYVEELAPAQQNQINFGSGVSYDFTGKNKSAWVLQFHGHVHTFTVDNLHYVANIASSTTADEYDVKRIACPNMCFVRNNEYGRNSGFEYYDIEFGTSDTYNKVADSGKDTAWNVVVINPSEEKVYAINYGSGYDREVYWGENVVAVTGVTLNAASGTLNPGGTVTLEATVAPSDATNKTVLWSTSDSTVATVANGVVTAVGVGTATITVTTQDGGFTATYALTVEAVKRGNIIGELGYQDNVRIGTSDGADRTGATGYVTVEYFEIDRYIDSYPAVIRFKGADFRSSTHSNSANVAYSLSKGFNSADYNSTGLCAALRNASWTCTFDSSGNMTWNCQQRPQSSIGYFRVCGYGSGANLDIRVNEDFD